VNPPRRSDEDGTVLVWLPALLAVAVLLGIATLEIGAHLVASARASALADAAALAAVSAQADERTTAPRQAADRVVAAGQGRLEACDCQPGTGRAEVAVSVAVPGVVRPPLGAARQAASAEAVLIRGVPTRPPVP
jgi:hypothetical protein